MYDFETHMEREGHDALAYDVIPYEGAVVKEGIKRIPMWVADMNFPVFPGIIKNMEERLYMPHFGYYNMSDEYYDSIINWHKERYRSNILKEHIAYENGVLGCLASAISALTKEGDCILTHSPVYVGFIKTIENLNRKLILSPLKKDEDGIYRMDLLDMEEKIKDNNIKFCLLCSPHNPTGRVWHKKELEEVTNLYAKYDCTVVCDEIWADIVLKGSRHIPYYSVNNESFNRSICMYAPSKTFNLAGLIGAYHVIPNKEIREKVDKVSVATHYNYCNVLSMYALTGAYTKDGGIWTDELNETINKNVFLTYDFFKNELKDIEVSRPEGTYMFLIDCGRWCVNNNISFDNLLKKGIYEGIIWNDGRAFHAGESIRLNLALPYDILEEALNRMKESIFI